MAFSQQVRSSKSQYQITVLGNWWITSIDRLYHEQDRWAQIAQMAQMPNTDGTDEFYLAQMGTNEFDLAQMGTEEFDLAQMGQNSQNSPIPV